MKTTIFLSCPIIFLSLCAGFTSISEYPYLYTVVVNTGFVPGQNTLRVCSAIELVEEQFYLTPKICFEQPIMNMEMKVALVQKKQLKFHSLVYEPFILRWETFSDYVILEKDTETDWELVVMDKSSIEDSFVEVDNNTETITEGDYYSELKTTMIDQENEEETWNSDHSDTRHTVSVSDFPNEHIASLSPSSRLDAPLQEGNDSSKASDKRKRYTHYKAHFTSRRRQASKVAKRDEAVLHPVFPEEDDLPPRVLITIPHSPLFSECFTLGWGTFFSSKQTLQGLEGLELKRSEISAFKPGATNTSEYYYTEIWFEREGGDKSFVQDIGSPLICKVKDRGNVNVIIGMYMGGNSSTNSEFDCYRSFKGEFYYITHWAIGANVSVTGDPAKWTLWPVEYGEEPKSFSMKITAKTIASIVILSMLLYCIFLNFV
ncbi:hypothetical protein HHI36_006936 [Cryptolaemus montrouzieri]|uniref:Uncharacterized protein n=1 Tax=Cryptolaemus montrouzieri TaxID=559131 RepID=A0ABD2MN23_9CUCU